MNIKRSFTSLCLLAFSLIINLKSNAQVFQLSLDNHYSNVLSEFGEKDISNPNAGHITYAYGTHLEFKYFTEKNIGFGIRASSSYYQRDQIAFQEDLIDALGIKTNYYYFTMTTAYWSIGTDLGILYSYKVMDDLIFEPYFYVGFRSMLSPADQVTFYQDGISYNYKKNPVRFNGVSFNPGIKVHWIGITDAIFINLYLEYEVASYTTKTEQSVLYSASSFKTASVDRTLSPQSFNVGLGISFFFGKGMREE